MLIRFVLDEYEMDTNWRVVILNENECRLFFEERNNLVRHKDEIFGRADIDEEWDDFQEWDDFEEWDSFGACCIPGSVNNEDIKYIKDKLDEKSLKTFNSETNFIQKLFSDYYDVEHLILINDKYFSTCLPKKRPEIIAHEAFHIIEYELYDQTHKGEEINETAEKLVEQYFSYLNKVQMKMELKKFCSNKKGKVNYGINRQQ